MEMLGYFDVRKIIDDIEEKRHSLTVSVKQTCCELEKAKKKEWIDERKTVEWNLREKNNLIARLELKLSGQKASYSALDKNVENAIISYLATNECISEAVARVVYLHAYSDGHSYGEYAVLDAAKTDAEFARDVLEAAK